MTCIVARADEHPIDNVLASNYFEQHLTSLLEKLHAEDSHAKAPAYLVIRALLARVGGEQRVEVAHRALQAMQLETLEGMGDFMHGVDDVASVCSIKRSISLLLTH